MQLVCMLCKAALRRAPWPCLPTAALVHALLPPGTQEQKGFPEAVWLWLGQTLPQVRVLLRFNPNIAPQV